MTTATTDPTGDPDLAAPLRTDADVLRRVDILVDLEARQERSAWLLFVAATGVQMPVVVPIDGVPEQPDPRTVSSLSWLIAEALRLHVPAGSAVVVLTRPGPTQPADADRAWAKTLYRAARDRGASLRLVCLATPDGVRQLASDHAG
jgi:hypothetical protein